MFQFLIGRLTSKIKNGGMKNVVYGFQFLIGRLTSQLAYVEMIVTEEVSIPHR